MSEREGRETEASNLLASLRAPEAGIAEAALPSSAQEDRIGCSARDDARIIAERAPFEITGMCNALIVVTPDLSSMWYYCIDHGKLRWDNINSSQLRRQQPAMPPPPSLLPARSQSHFPPKHQQ